MKNKNMKPLIRKEYSFFEILRIIFSGFLKSKSGYNLRIPGFAGSVGFRSLASNSNTGNAAALSQFSREQIFSAMTENNLRGFGGGGFPMAEKLKSVMGSGNPEPVLIINGAECDPGLYHDKWIIENKAEELENISKILRSSFCLSGVYLAKKAGTPDPDVNGITVVDVPDIYPAGEERRLVSWLLGVECGKENYPAEKGIWVQNVQSLLFLNSVLSGITPQRYITMTDLNRKSAFVVECDPDAAVGKLADEVFGDYSELHLGGGIMQGFPAEGDEKLDSSINLIAAGKAPEFPDSDCRHCGQCSKHCPDGLPVEDLVAEILKSGVQKKDRLADCSRCGACSFLCPAGKDICSLIASVAIQNQEGII